MMSYRLTIFLAALLDSTVALQLDDLRAIEAEVPKNPKKIMLHRSKQHETLEGSPSTSEEENHADTALPRAMFSYKFDYNKSDHRPVDAWLYMAHKTATKENNMYIPMLLTVEAGLESFGANVRVVDRYDAEDMVKQVRETVARTGKAPLVVGVAFGRAGSAYWQGTVRYSGGEYEPILRKCAEAGAYIALYNTEPFRTESVAGAAKGIGAQEVWDYNMYNVREYEPDGAFIARYVPPGYLTKVASVASHVNLESSSRNESKIGFMGRFGYRPQETQDEIMRQFGQSFQPSKSVWTWDDYVQWVDQYPMQLNVHRTGDPSLETFRMSMLLTFKACIISAPSDPADMQAWEGILHFAEISGMLDVFNEVTRRDTGVRDCQLKSFKEFQKRFHPKVIIQNSGLLNDWQPGQAVD